MVTPASTFLGGKGGARFFFLGGKNAKNACTACKLCWNCQIRANFTHLKLFLEQSGGGGGKKIFWRAFAPPPHGPLWHRHWLELVSAEVLRYVTVVCFSQCFGMIPVSGVFAVSGIFAKLCAYSIATRKWTEVWLVCAYKAWWS